MTNETKVVLVDTFDTEIGVMDKNQAHLHGALHRAISVFIFNSKKEWLLQRRAENKYHSPGEWTNTCCTHPFPNEDYHQAALRRLKEEMGISPEIEEQFRQIYKAELDNGMTEHELDAVFIGFSDEIPHPDPLEVAEYRYVKTKDLVADVTKNPHNYTPWFLKFYPRIEEVIAEKGLNG